MIILDTNVVSELARRSPRGNVKAWIDASEAEDLYLSAVTVGELRFGAWRLRDPLQRDRTMRLVDMIRERFPNEQVLVYDTACAERLGEARGLASRAGRAVSDADAMIAATALVHGCAVATRDTSPFEAMGVAVIDPWAA